MTNTELAKELCEQLGIPYDIGPGYATLGGESLKSKSLKTIMRRENQCEKFDYHIPSNTNIIINSSVIGSRFYEKHSKHFIIDDVILMAA